MKKAVLATCLAAIGAAPSANVFLPNIGLDGWSSDSEYFRAAAFNQGYLTASGVQNHTINPAFALELMDTAEVRLDSASNFSGGAFTNLFGQNVGVYFGRMTFDGNLYNYDSDGDGNFDDSIIGDVDADGNDESISNLFDAYWASGIAAGTLGTRLNVRAIAGETNTDLQDDDTNVGSEGSLMEMNATLGFVSNSLPLEATATLGLPFGGFESINEDTAANTKMESSREIDQGLRWGAIGKYTLLQGAGQTTLISGFVGGTSSNYRIESTNTSGGTTITTQDTTHIQERFAMGIVGSHERVLNNQTRLVASAGLTRQSSKIGMVDNQPSPSEPNHDRYITYTVPVALGVEFRKSDKTDFIGSVSSNLYDRSTNENYDNDNGDAAEESNFSASWSMPATNVQLGFAYQMTPRLQTNFVIDKDLFTQGLNSALTTQAQFTYEF